MKENFERRGCCALSATKEHNMFNPKMEAMSRDERHALQSERLRWTVKHEYENVPVYRARMDAKGIRPEDVHGLEDLKYLPFMEKTDLRDHFPYGLLAVPLHDIVRIQGSSGTTGRPIVSGYTQHDVDVWTELMARTISAAGGGADESSAVPADGKAGAPVGLIVGIVAAVLVLGGGVTVLILWKKGRLFKKA